MSDNGDPESFLTKRIREAQENATSPRSVVDELGKWIRQFEYYDDASVDAKLLCHALQTGARLAATAAGELLEANCRIAELTEEVDVLRRYGNKSCTAMADEELARLRDKPR